MTTANEAKQQAAYHYSHQDRFKHRQMMEKLTYESHFGAGWDAAMTYIELGELLPVVVEGTSDDEGEILTTEPPKPKRKIKDVPQA